MIHSIQITGYRGFDKFEMTGLGRLNLLVGTNNSGKTSVLEAIYLLTSAADPGALWQLVARRGEWLATVERNHRYIEPEIDISHLFTGHEISLGSKFSIGAKNQSPERSISFTVAEPNENERREMIATGPSGAMRSQFVLHIKGSPHPTVANLPMTRRGGILPDMIDASRRIRRGRNDTGNTQFISTESMTGDQLVTLWDKVALSPDESLVLRALQFLDDKLERIAAQASGREYYGASRGGFIIKRRGYEHPLPIGSMGDGMWRMLAMAIAITQCKGGVLLIDEVDTGLHYSVMADMWKLIHGAAKEFNVQVFATTHSSDCVDSLAKICTDGTDDNNHVTLQRIEAGKSKAIPYSEKEIQTAADRGIEVR